MLIKILFILRSNVLLHKGFSSGEMSGAVGCLIKVLHIHCCVFCCSPPSDPNPKVERLYDSDRDDHMLRVQNFSILNRHLRAFYQVGEAHWKV